MTLVYAAYAVGLLTALLAFGRASDSPGRRPALLAPLAVSGVSSLVFVLVGARSSGGLPILFVGRVLSGASAGMFTGTATAALADFAGKDRQLRASVVAAVANIGGLGLGPLLSGLLARHAGRPLQTSYLVHAVVIVVAVAAILAVPEPVRTEGPRRLHSQRLGVPAVARSAFLQAGTAGFAGFALLGPFTAVSPSLLALLGHHNTALTGVVVFAVFAASRSARWYRSRYPPDQLCWQAPRCSSSG